METTTTPTLAQRVAIYALAAIGDAEVLPGVAITFRDIAGERIDALPPLDAARVELALRAAEVSL
jgi:hypothetical protein